MDKPRRKRLKVSSACGECRRKKTRCNGQLPCAGCIKANANCQYAAPRHPPFATHDDPSPSPPQIVFQSHVPDSSSIQAIEQRLAAIEDILRTLLDSSAMDPSPCCTSPGRPKRQRTASEGSTIETRHETLPLPPAASLGPREPDTGDPSDALQLPPLQHASPAISNLLNRDTLPVRKPLLPTSSFQPSAFQQVVASPFS